MRNFWKDASRPAQSDGVGGPSLELEHIELAIFEDLLPLACAVLEHTLADGGVLLRHERVGQLLLRPLATVLRLGRPARRLALHARLARWRSDEIALWPQLAASSPQPAATHNQPLVMPLVPAVVVHEQLALVAVATLVHHRRAQPVTVRVLCFQLVAQPCHGPVRHTVEAGSCRGRGRAHHLGYMHMHIRYVWLHAVCIRFSL